jgi:zinc metalloprotease ZmpB
MALVGMGVVLLAAVVVGQQIGEHTIFGATEHRVELPEPTITPVAQETGQAEEISRNWKRLQVVSVATDPAFPDPRVTPRPAPTPRPTPSPKPSPTIDPAELYTAPPLPQAQGSQPPGATPTP